MNDTELEELLRAGLQRRAEDADTTADLLAPVRAGARSQRRRRLAVVGTIGLAAAALVTAVVVQSTGGSGGPDRTDAVDQGPSEPLPSEWRTEVWHGLQVEVPADWGWGVAPVPLSVDPGGQHLCGGPGALVDADGRRRANPNQTAPWVGRPVMASDLCLGSVQPDAQAPYVWLGAMIAPGTVDAGNGYTQETVEVAGTTLTVATRDDALRQQIIGSATGVEGCAPTLDSQPTVDSMLTEGLRDPSSAQVCAYRREHGAAAYDLVYATVLDPERATAYHAQVYDGGFERSPDFCETRDDERVLITVTGDDPYGSTDVTQATVVDPTCREVSGSPGMVSPLSDQGMRAWSHNGAQVTLRGLIGGLG